MKVTWGLENATFNPKTATTLGSYDGIHLGHKQILSRLRDRKKELNLERTLLITFHPHPQEVLRKNNTSVELLTTIDERLELIEKEGIDETLVIKFTREFSQTSYLDFFNDTIIKALGTKAMVVGFNHAFGRNREGDADRLKTLAPELGVTIEEVQPVSIDGISLSSSKIRLALKAGDIANANKWLGRPYSFTGNVVHGDALGRTLGYPTANLELDPSKLVPADGVYAATATVNGRHYRSALSIGNKPTTHTDGDRVIEALLIDFEGELYGKNITVECLQYLRPQEKFASLEELKLAIARDLEAVRLSKLSNKG